MQEPYDFAGDDLGLLGQHRVTAVSDLDVGAPLADHPMQCSSDFGRRHRVFERLHDEHGGVAGRRPLGRVGVRQRSLYAAQLALRHLVGTGDQVVPVGIIYLLSRVAVVGTYY